MEGKGAGWSGLVSLAVVFIIAGVFFLPAGRSGASSLSGGETQSKVLKSPWRRPAIPSPQTVRLLLSDGQVASVGLEDYIYGVVCAEMPASFEPEALKAQAVAARTYALRKLSSGVHAPDAQLCADPGCCQAYTAREPESWGDQARAYGEKIHQAVSATAGEVLTQDGQLIDAVFHASSAGYTAPAQEVWGAAAPYLVSVSTPETVDNVPGFQEERAFTAQELEALLGSAELGNVTYWDWGGVHSMEVGGNSLSGPEVRQRLGLRSARFTVEARDGAFVFTTLGYGHGVGMSQQGANLMAKDGSDYREILSHYYPGTQLTGG